MELKNKVVFITGSSIGIGKETALAFAKEGSKIIITHNTNKEEAEKTLKECKKLTECSLFHLDVTKTDSIKKVVKNTIDKFGSIDILINNAGVIVWKNFIEQSEDEIESQININLIGLMNVTKIVIQYMEKEGMIINISSAAGKVGYAEIVPYCASKFGVRGFTKALALELPENIKTYIVNPDITATQITKYTGLHRPNIYDIIEKLHKKGLASFVIKNNVKYFRASSPTKILDYIKEKEEKIKKILPELIELSKEKKKNEILYNLILFLHL